jgi:hypothetical protein
MSDKDLTWRSISTLNSNFAGSHQRRMKTERSLWFWGEVSHHIRLSSCQGLNVCCSMNANALVLLLLWCGLIQSSIYLFYTVRDSQ